MTKKTPDKITPITASMHYDAAVTSKAHEYAPMFQEAFPTKTALLIAVDNSTRFLKTAYDALDGDVSAEYFCLHGPLSEYPDQLLSLMVLFIDTGVFVSTDPDVKVFSLQNAKSWKYQLPVIPENT